MKKCLFCGNFEEDNTKLCTKCGSAKFEAINEQKSMHGDNSQTPTILSPEPKTIPTPPGDIVGEFKNTRVLNQNSKKSSTTIIISIATAIIGAIAIILYLTVFPLCDHEYVSEITLEPTIHSTGTTEYNCNKCGKSYTESIPILPKTEENLKLEKQRTCNHEYKERVVKKPTYSTPGDMRYYCPKCEHAYNGEIAVLPTVLEVDVTGKHMIEGKDKNFVNFTIKAKNITDSDVLGFKGKLYVTVPNDTEPTLTLFCDIKDTLIPANFTITYSDYGYDFYKYSIGPESKVAHTDFKDLECWFEVTKIY